ncbi:MFS transporter [Sphingobium sufflavum]|uniref:MFS transporter n=1 Tax=Sphingobium sufflavum TaxID=1129547 RepID=UPI001F316451|nr:MFS transporter [Sphingobium sufflavum]MCE7797477.1 MFS transporter [Sphingobium sufflavum]
MQQANPSPEKPFPSHPLHVPAFRAYLTVRFAAVIAQQGMTLIIAWQTYNIARLTMSPALAVTQLGLIGLIQFVALFLATPLSGLLADRYNRRVLAMLTILGQLASALILAVSSYEQWIGLPLIFTLAALLGVCRAFQGPSLGSLTANIVPLPILPRAFALSSIAWQSGSIIGPAISGYAYAIQPHFAYAASAILFLVSLLMLALMGPVKQAQPDRKRHPLRQIVDGLAYVKRNRLVQATITLDLFAVLLAGTTALLPVYARDILHVGSKGLGHLAAAPGIGAAAMALFFSIFPMTRNVGVKMLASVVIFGAATVCFGATAFMPAMIQMPVALGAMMVWGAADMVSVFVRQSLVQLHTPDEMRGRVSSVSQLTISASNELGEAESGFLAALIGPVSAVILGGVGAIAVTLLWSRLYPELRLARSFDPPDVANN